MKRAPSHFMAFSLFVFILMRGIPVLAQATESSSAKRLPAPRWVDFYREGITITCHEREVEIEGIYYFRNLTGGTITMTIQYPFPVDAHHPFPHEIVVENYSFRKDSSSIYLDFSMNPREEKSIRIRYRQLHYNKSAKYILSSTQHWDYPIQQADFAVSAPQAWKTGISLEPGRKDVKEGRVIYYISRRNFSPKEDLVIRWQ